MRIRWIGWVVVLALGAAATADWPGAAVLPRAPFMAGTNGEFLPQFDSVRCKVVGPDRYACTFRLSGRADASGVALAGTFNNWNRVAQRMKRNAGENAWECTLELPAGRHEYRFIANGDEWFSDPLNLTNGDVGANSIVKLGRLAYLTESPACLKDGEIDLDGVAHDAASPMYFQPLASGDLLVRLRTFAHDIERAEVLVADGPTVAMHPVHRTALFDYFEAEIPTAAARNGAGEHAVKYTFALQDGTRNGVVPQVWDERFAERAVFRTPEWAMDAVWYQIMLDRFRNGDPQNDPPRAHPWTSEWFKAQPWEEASGQEFYKFFVFDRLYGGDLAGLREKLPYLQKLGVNALYLNPVFEADSHHKYNATNYIHIDDNFGTLGDYADAVAKEQVNDPHTWIWTASDKLFLNVIQDAHRHGMRVVIDGVFNHVGTNHPAFLDVLKNKQASPYAEWFEITSWEPFEYTGWAGHGALPVFRKSADGLASEACKQHIFDVTRRWMDPNGDGDPSDGIDGWRLDVPNEIALPFWAEWRTLVKSINPDAYITGEIWDRADQWLDGRHFDAVMNYQFAAPTIAWAMYDQQKLKASELDSRLAELRLAYPRAATYVMQNLVDSHDTDRLVSMALNPDRRYDDGNRPQDNGPGYDNAKPQPVHYQRARLVALVQMTYVGAPMIYYGDEVGMWGADDPTCRKPMWWADLAPYENSDENAIMPAHLAAYERMIALRKDSVALRRGEFETLLADDAQDAWVFARYDGDDKVIVALTASAAPQQVTFQLPEGWPAKWDVAYASNPDEPAERPAAADGRLTIRIPAIGGVVLRASVR